ncbi:MAG: glycosyltransferase [Planctomycetota bacterium]
MKVLLISRGDLVHLRPFMDYMQARDWEVHLAELSPTTFDAGDVTRHNCYLDDGYPKLLNYFYAGRMVRRLCRELKPDLLWGHYVTSAGTVAWLSGVRPYVLTVHGSDVLYESKKWTIRQLLKRMFRHAALIHTVSPQIDDRIVELGTSRDKLSCLAFGIEADAIEFTPRDSELHRTLRLACTRSLQNFIYDIPTLIRAMGELKQRNVEAQLTLCGTGALEPEFRAMVAELGVEETVTFGGGFRPNELNDILREHDVYVSASISDGASLSLLEAMASGIFPVVSDIESNRVWLDEKRARLFPTGDHVALADCIEELAGQSRLPTDGRDNRELIEEKADRPKNMNQVLDELEKVVKRS